MKITDDQIEELNKLLRKTKLNLPINKKIVCRHTSVYGWLQKNILTKNNEKVTQRIKELLDIV